MAAANEVSIEAVLAADLSVLAGNLTDRKTIPKASLGVKHVYSRQL